MRRRLIGMMIGGVLGVGAASALHADLGFSANMTLVLAAAVGMALGTVATLLLDVFLAPSGRLNSFPQD